MQTMQMRDSQSDNSSQVSEESQPLSPNGSLVDHLRERGLATESLRFADVNDFIDPDGNRYRIQRVPSDPPAQQNASRTLPRTVEARLPPPEPQRITNRARFAQTLSDPFPSASGRLTEHQRLIPDFLCNDDGDDSSTMTASRTALRFIDSDVQYSRIVTGHNMHSIDQTVTLHGPNKQQIWRPLEQDAPRLELAPMYPEPPAPISRNLRTGSEPIITTSPVSVLGTSRSNTGVPYSVYNGIDLRTPVIVVGSETSTVSGESLVIDTETPGERLLLDMDMAISTSPIADFVSSQMRIFLNTDTDDLRFYIVSEWQGNRTAQSFRMPRSSADYVPVYGYSVTHSRVICIREILRRRKRLTRNNNDQPLPTADAGLSVYCEFHNMQDLFEFQKKLLDEEVFLDIERARYMKIVENGSGLHTRQIDAPRLQIWREARSGKAAFSDNMSHYTAGTTLSGPMKDRIAPSVSRLFIYLGRSEEYMSIFITDDVTLQEKGSTKLNFTATRFGILKSRGSIQCLHTSRSQTAAGIKLDKSGLRYEEQSGLKSYKSIEIELETTQNRLMFVETWDKVLQARRKERMKLKAIEEEVANDVYTGKMARRIIM